MGTVGLAVTGGGFFNHLSRPDGSLALANEGRTLDSCLGHSAGGGTYHYHANINCTDAGAATGANNPDTCLKIGYYRDGVPVYGFCKDNNGAMMTSCYSLVSGSTTYTLETVSGTYNVASTSSSYEYKPAPDCNLDEGNGKDTILPYLILSYLIAKLSFNFNLVESLDGFILYSSTPTTHPPQKK